jgi:hypothetical protein
MYRFAASGSSHASSASSLSNQQWEIVERWHSSWSEDGRTTAIGPVSESAKWENYFAGREENFY